MGSSRKSSSCIISDILEFLGIDRMQREGGEGGVGDSLIKNSEIPKAI